MARPITECDAVALVSDAWLYLTNQGVFIVKDLSIEKLEPKDMGQYHIRAKVDELVEVVNELIKMMQEIGAHMPDESGPIEIQSSEEFGKPITSSQSSDTSTD